MSHSPFTNLGSNQDPDEWHAQKVDREQNQKTMITKAKIIGENVSYETYSAQEAKRGDKEFSMSRGELTNFASNPARWLAGYKIDDGETDATRWGSMIDCLLTSPEKFDAIFAVSPETYPDAKTGEQKPWTMAANFCKAWKKEQGEKTIIKADVKSEADKAVAAMKASELIEELFALSQKQVLVLAFWQDEETGLEIPIRGLLDLVPPKSHPIFGKWLADFKTARDGDPSKWANTVAKHGYDVQAALYKDIYTAATGEDRVDFVHIVQENIFPFHVVTPPPALSCEFLDWGRSKYQSALRLYCRCLASGKWPSFPVVGMEYGNTQIIDPKSVWEYVKCAGMKEFREPPKLDPQPEQENFDTTP